MILVTGSGGNIGSIICEKLLENGEKVLGVGRSSLDTKRYEYIQCDVTDRNSLEKIFSQYSISAVIHLASLLNTASRNSPELAARVNVGGALNLLEFCKEKNIRFVYGSSFNAIGGLDSNINNSITENDGTKPEEFYGQTKDFVEAMGTAMSKTYGFEFASARIPTIVGAGQGSKNSPWRGDIFDLLKEGGKTRINFEPNEYVPLSHVDDAAESIIKIALADKVNHTIYNLPNESIKMKELIEIVEKINPKLEVECGDAKVKGIPCFVSWKRYKEEFNYKFSTIEEKLKEIIKK